eukprot:CAMPEP_0198116664 /NCGR_PEP_ID=MMETSP1442-20131203/13884_1 /TAXON_ID= /ORGANISM="Craspedostauros australis, Strain CCMP3328" /LENGTH=297 /DNA_ID=CAMNT_0043774541 /DNA_START=130 /DNA_END=1023 /DNA_ORIENTATION=-
MASRSGNTAMAASPANLVAGGLLVCLGMLLICMAGSSQDFASVDVDMKRNLKAGHSPPAGPRSSTPHTGVFKCDKEPTRAMRKSQFGEDKHLRETFPGLCGGSYIEMGALDGVHLSNTHMFNVGLDWKGVLIEANPFNFKKLVENRKNDLAVVHAGVCNEEMDLHWVSVENGATGGFREFISDRLKKTWWNNKIVEEIVVKCKRLETILATNVPDVKYFDFFSLDVEGAELSVLESIDLDTYQFGYFVIEADGHNPPKEESIKQLLESKGYEFIGVDHHSALFVHPNFRQIYSHVIP